MSNGLQKIIDSQKKLNIDKYVDMLDLDFFIPDPHQQFTIAAYLVNLVLKVRTDLSSCKETVPVLIFHDTYQYGSIIFYQKIKAVFSEIFNTLNISEFTTGSEKVDLMVVMGYDIQRYREKYGSFQYQFHQNAHQDHFYNKELIILTNHLNLEMGLYYRHSHVINFNYDINDKIKKAVAEVDKELNTKLLSPLISIIHEYANFKIPSLSYLQSILG